MIEIQLKSISTPARLLLLFAFAVFGVKNQVTAQIGAGGHRPDGPPPTRSVPDSIDVTQMVKHLSLELNLSETQQSKIAELSQTHFTAVRAKMKEQKKERIKMREAHEGARKEFEKELKSVLNGEQAKKFDEILQTRRPPHQHGKGPKRR